jgi:hypothetical protein
MYSISQNSHIWPTALMENQQWSAGIGAVEHSFTCTNLNHTIFEAQAMAEKCEVKSWSMGENILRMGLGGR